MMKKLNGLSGKRGVKPSANLPTASFIGIINFAKSLLNGGNPHTGTFQDEF
ncbi:MAG: hypothetical protein RMX68_008710 [Aulosira sp. ZfuVER01]|nr:hypothetical protein [Aulosira sp. ZfuCHP01]